MAGAQGKRFSEDEIAKIRCLLATTDMSVPDIALRMRCSGTAILSINRHYNIRRYDGKRSCWKLASSPAAEAVTPQPSSFPAPSPTSGALTPVT